VYEVCQLDRIGTHEQLPNKKLRTPLIHNNKYRKSLIFTNYGGLSTDLIRFKGLSNKSIESVDNPASFEI